MALRPCLQPGCGAVTSRSRCADHTAARKQVRNADRPIARAVVAAQPWCTICGATADLTADHLIPLAHGGTNHGPRRTLCRSCNSSRGAGPP